LSFFAAEPNHTAFDDGARCFWADDGARIVATMERVSGLRFQDTAITVIMRASAGSSGAGGDPTSPIRVDIRYPMPMSLIHELGHRLSHQVLDAARNVGLDGHKLLYLYLYDVWEELYGTAVADRWRDTERGWAELGFGFIKEAWDWADSLGRAGRAAKLRELVAAAKR
jgi:hypothetical protein